MKIKNKLFLGYVIVALVFLIPFFITIYNYSEIQKHNHLINSVTLLSENLNLQENLIISYIETAEKPKNQKIEQNVEIFFKQISDELQLKEKRIKIIQDNNEKIFEIIKSYLIHSAVQKKNLNDKQAINVLNSDFTSISEIVQKIVNHYNVEINTAKNQITLANRIENERLFLENIFDKNKDIFSKKINIYNNTKQENVLTVFAEMAYKEKEFIWQYKDKKHKEDVFNNIQIINTIIPQLDISQKQKEEILSKTSKYKELINLFNSEIKEIDFNSWSALDAKLARNLWLIRHKDLMEPFIYNLEKSVQFQTFIHYPYKEFEIYHSFEELFFKLGFYEKLLIFQDEGEKTTHHTEMLDVYEKSVAMLPYLNISEQEKETISVALLNYKNTLNTFLNVRQNRYTALDKLSNDYSKRMDDVHHTFQKLQIGISKDDTIGLDFIIKIIIEENQNIVHNTLYILLITEILAILACIMISYHISTSLSNPIIELRNASQDIASGKMNARVNSSSVEEISDLSIAFNKMANTLGISQKKLKKMNQELEHKNEQLQFIDKQKDEFISLAAHELKTPLTSVKGFTQLLKNDNVANNLDKRKRFLKNIDTNTDRLYHLVCDLVDSSRISLGKLKINIENVESSHIFNEIKTEIEVVIKEKGIIPEFSIEENLPKIKCDLERTLQVLRNLLINAVHYTEKDGKISLNMSKKDDFVLFEVKDTGQGIPDSTKEFIFSKFYQVDSSMTRKVGGSGLGLSVGKGLVELMKGHIWFESEQGKGTSFYFTLPIAEGEK